MIRPLLIASLVVPLLCASPAHAQRPRMVVFFAEWSGALDEAARAVIRDAAKLATASPTAHLTVTGYADNKGTPAANRLLSALRAQVVVDALERDGTPASKVSTSPGGAVPATGVVGRRVEIAISGDQ